jgi:predicted metal-dependent HD superfamily phosphohydrolase
VIPPRCPRSTARRPSGKLDGMSDLVDRFRAAAVGAGVPAGPGVTEAGTELLARWCEPHRHYHTVAHLVAVLDVIDAYASLAQRPDLVRLAAWCHDAVYDPTADGGGNELSSADLGGRVLRTIGAPAAAIDEVRRLVLLTAGHGAAPGDPDGALLCDADLAILASPAAEYDRYAAAIRREYAHVPESAFRAGRAAVLVHLLGLPRLFSSPPLGERWERPARRNLERELAGLRP